MRDCTADYGKENSMFDDPRPDDTMSCPGTGYSCTVREFNAMPLEEREKNFPAYMPKDPPIDTEE